MKFNIETISPVKKMLHIEIPEGDVEKALNDAYLELKKTVKIKGFRPGKTPRTVLERLYGKNIHKDVSSQIVQNSLSEALRDSDLKFVGCKNIEPPELIIEKPYLFSLEIDVKPEINEIDFKGLKLERKLYTISDEDIEVQLKMLQKNLAKQKTIENSRPVKEGDFVDITCEKLRNKTSSKELDEAKDFSMKIGTSTISPDLDKGIIGMNVGDEKEILVNFPEDYHDTNFSGLEVNFKVKVKNIKKEFLPEINDDMAKQLGPFKDLENLKFKISQNLEEGYEKRKEQELNEQIFTQLIDRTQFELPDSLVKQELDSIITDAERSFKYHNKSLEDAGLTREILMEKYEEVAKKQVRRQLILGQIIEQESMIVSDDALEEGFKNMSLSYNTPIDNIKTIYNQNPDKLDALKHALLEKQAIDLIIKKNDVKEIESNLISTEQK